MYSDTEPTRFKTVHMYVHTDYYTLSTVDWWTFYYALADFRDLSVNSLIMIFAQNRYANKFVVI